MKRDLPLVLLVFLALPLLPLLFVLMALESVTQSPRRAE